MSRPTLQRASLALACCKVGLARSRNEPLHVGQRVGAARFRSYDGGMWDGRPVGLASLSRTNRKAACHGYPALADCSSRGVDRFWPEKLLRRCQALIPILFPRTLQKDCRRATNADRFGVSNFPLPLFESGPKSCSTVVTSSRPDSAGRVRGRDGRTRSGAAGRISGGAVRNGSARRDERHAVATFRAPRQVDLVRGF